MQEGQTWPWVVIPVVSGILSGSLGEVGVVKGVVKGGGVAGGDVRVGGLVKGRGVGRCILV